ncbi:MAG: glycerol-3-phosphate 1-O-acyltransferase PlsY [Dehalococcoidia bacterium]|nr:glycerol-3-phosphate 1-O-acyltransferase PlsY [Dehalococcoidia bacterium]
MIVLEYFAAALIGYLLGAIPFGIIISKMARGIDIRMFGSGKTGTTNVIRAAGGRAGLVTMILDLAKACAAVMIAWAIVHTHTAQVVAGLAAVVGHIWSVYIRFQGGRGVATYVGGLMAMNWLVGLCTAVLILGIGRLTRYMSLGSIVGMVASFLAMLGLMVWGMRPPIIYLTVVQPVQVVFCGLAAGIILVQHRDNVQRLLKGTERKLGGRAETR